MSWMLSMWVAAALLALCMGESTVLEGMSQPVSGFHLCNHNETRNVSFLAIHKVPYSVTKQCGDWLLLKTCTVKLYRMVHQTEYRSVMEEVTRCCDGYEQVGRYCALPVNRSGEFTAKPGICPTADGLDSGSEACEWDMDCPGWQKCCHRLDRYLCTNPARPASSSESGGRRFNATVTVKADYQQVMSKDGDGHLNHIRLLQAMVTGALQADVSVYYLGSQPVHPYRTATSLLIEFNSTLSLHNVTATLHLLLVYIQEVSSVTVEDINECTHPALHQCSLHANCTNTEDSYHCTCLQGYTDVDPSNPGAHCRDESTTTEPPHSYVPPMNTTYTPASNTTQEPLKISTVGFVSSTEIIVTADLSNTSSVSSYSSHAPQWTSPAPQTTMRSTVESTPPTTTCSPPSITSVWSAEVTGTSFSIYWSSQSQTNQTYQVVVSRGSDVVHFYGTSDTMMEVQGLQPGVLYNVTVTPCACGSQGGTFSISVKTDAQTLDATARLTNINFTADLQNTSSQAFRNLTESFTDEIYQSLSAEMKAMVDSGLVRIVIKGFSPGSVVVNFTLIVIPSQTQDISNVSAAVLNSLINSTKYTVDINNTSINDFDECASGENDCSQWATCTNTWASYTCVCLDGFIDQNTERPGRACQVKSTETTTFVTPTIFSTVRTSPFSQLTTQANDVALTPVTTTPGETTVIISTSETDTSRTLVSTTGSVKETAVPVVIHVQVTTAMTVTTPIPITTSSTPAITTTPPRTAFSTTETTIPASTPTTPAPTTTIPASTTATPAPKTPTPAPTTTIPASTPTTPAPTTTIPASTPTTPAPTTTIPASTPTTPAPTTTIPASTPATPASKTPTPAPKTTAPSTGTSALITTSPATTITASITTTPMLKTTMTSPTLKSTTAIPALTTTTAPNTTTAVTQTTTPAPTMTTSTSKTPTTVATTSSSTTTTTPITTPLTSTPAMTTTIKTQIPTTTVPTKTTARKTTTAPKKPTTVRKTSKTLLTTTSIAMASTTSIPKTNPTIITTTSSSALSTNTNASILGAISALCRAAAITVIIAKDFLQSANIRESALYLGHPECGVNVGNATHAELTVAWNECATRLVQNETFFTASVTLFNSMDPYILPSGAVEVPKLRLEVPIVCTYMKSMLISADFGSTGYDMIKDVITGSGVFQVTVQLMNGTRPLPHNYSMSSEEDVVVEVSLNTTSEQIKVVITKCWATPSPNSGDTYSHTFLENSCSLNSYTKVLINGNSSTSRLSVKIFSIVNLDVIYLHCRVQICVQMGSDTCVPDCLQRAARSLNTIGTALGTYGPILRSDEESLEEDFNTIHIAGLACLGIGISLFFIIGFVCLFYYQRNRIGHYNFSVKPKQENFTYLVFNT
ncbi:uromodulin-like 1 [Tautogolabrus adspersus]